VFPNVLQFASNDLLYFRLNKNWSFDFFDQGISTFTGYPVGALRDREVRWLDLVHEDDRALLLEDLDKALAEDKSFFSVHRIIKTSGQTRWVKIRGSVFCDDEGRFSCIQGIMNDITREKLIEEALESESEIFAWVANNLEDGIYIVSEDHRIKFMNQALIDLVGDQVGELCYKALFDRDSICPWSVMHHIQQASCGFQDYVLEKLGRAFQVRSFPIKMKDGSIGKLGQLRDVTKTKILQHELKEFTVREEALAFAADVANVGIFIVQSYRGMEARFRYANEAFCRITGFGMEDLPQMSLCDIIPAGSYQKVSDLLNGGGSLLNRASSCELHLTCKGGAPIVALFTASSSVYRGKPALTGFLQDITQSKKVQESLWLSQRLASIGKLAAEVAHEINNPLTSVLTFTKLAARIVERDRIGPGRLKSLREYLGHMESEANRCAGIARNLLDFSRQGEIEIKKNDLREIIEKTLGVLRHRAEMGSITLQTVYEPRIPKLLCDYKRLQQAFINIFWNSIEAMPQGGLLEVTVACDRKKRQTYIDIRDTGTGIPEANLGKIFEPFFTTKAESRGVGLGLSVAYGIIRQHGGSIEVRSRLDKGTVFSICLPEEKGTACAEIVDSGSF
jgi:PAS domain S-box-containing protein